MGGRRIAQAIRRPEVAMRKKLQEILRCDDQNAMIHDCVVSHDPAPGAWSHHSAPQSPLGTVGFPEMIGSDVLSVVQGLVYTAGADGQVIEHALTEHQWLPWSYSGRGAQIHVERTVARDVWFGRVRLIKRQPAFLLLELHSTPSLGVQLERHSDHLSFAWGKQFEIELSFSPCPVWMCLSDDPGPLKRKFAGFDDVKLNDAHCNWAWKNTGKLWLAVAFRWSVEVRFQVRRLRRPKTRPLSFAMAKRNEEKRWTDFLERQVPRLTTDNPVLRDTYYFGWQSLWSNRCDIGAGQLRRPFTSPSRLSYGAQWWYDEPFNAVVYSHLKDPWTAYACFENFWPCQKPDGSIPGCVRMLITDQPAMSMQPPVIGLMLQLLKERPGWPKNLCPMYEALLGLARWHLSPRRDTDQDGLAEYHHCFDGPADQSQRWDSQKLDPAKVIDAIRPTESVDMNVWMSLLWQVLGEMANRLGHTRAAAQHDQIARHTMELVEKHMWDERDGFYYDIDGRTHEKIRVKTPYGLMPLLSPLVRPERAERIVAQVFDPKVFWCKYPLPSVSLDCPTFNPVDMFRGPTWVNQNWLVIVGLQRQGYHRQAARLARKTIELVGPRYRGGHRIRSPRFWEWYHPHTGEALGNPQYTWSAGLAVDLILRFFANGWK